MVKDNPKLLGAVLMALGASNCVCGLDVPEGAVRLEANDSGYVAALTAWSTTGQKAPQCPLPWLATVTSDEFEAAGPQDGLKSCGRFPPPLVWGKCRAAADEAPVDEPDKFPAIVYFDENLKLNQPARDYFLAHELFHIWSNCLEHDADPNHVKSMWSALAHPDESKWERLP